MPNNHLPVPAELLRHHVAYTIWATRRLLVAAATLTPQDLTRDFGTADRNVFGTLTHLFRSERTWLARIEEGAPAISHKVAGNEELSFLTEGWTGLHQRWHKWANGLQDADTNRVLEYTDLKGSPRAEPLWPIVLHVVNHSTHHRGQISGFLRALGQLPPSLDLIAFVRLSKYV